MKPRIRLKGGVWSCASKVVTFAGYVWRIGYGYSPVAAWADWKAQDGIPV